MFTKNQIYYNPNGDTRTLDHLPSKDEVLDAIETHQTNMAGILKAIGDVFYEKAEKHDSSVVDHFDEYYDSVLSTMKENASFKDTEWYDLHYLEEDYHRNKVMPKESNLFDLIEAICDQVVVSNERRIDKGIIMDEESVHDMYLNTIRILEDSLEIVL